MWNTCFGFQYINTRVELQRPACLNPVFRTLVGAAGMLSNTPRVSLHP